MRQRPPRVEPEEKTPGGTDFKSKREERRRRRI